MIIYGIYSQSHDIYPTNFIITHSFNTSGITYFLFSVLVKHKIDGKKCYIKHGSWSGRNSKLERERSYI